MHGVASLERHMRTLTTQAFNTHKPLDTHSQCEPGTTHVSSKGQRCLWSLKRPPGTRCGSSSFTSVSNHFIKLTELHHSLCAWCHCVKQIAQPKMKMTKSVLSLLYPNGHSAINHILLELWMCSQCFTAQHSIQTVYHQCYFSIIYILVASYNLLLNKL